MKMSVRGEDCEVKRVKLQPSNVAWIGLVDGIYVSSTDSYVRVGAMLRLLSNSFCRSPKTPLTCSLRACTTVPQQLVQDSHHQNNRVLQLVFLFSRLFGDRRRVESNESWVSLQYGVGCHIPNSRYMIKSRFNTPTLPIQYYHVP